MYSVMAVGLGAACGAWLRWWLGILLNPVFSAIPLGTLTANLVGGYLIGIAIEYFLHYATLSSEIRLFVITGFLGGLTTFSTFSVEAVTLLQRFQYGWALTMILLHLAGSLVMTVAGVLTVRYLMQ